MFGSRKKLLTNFSSLTILQIANYIFPLILFPYLVRIFGPEKYGLISFAGAFVTYFSILTDFGFNFSATQSVSVNRENSKELSKIFGSVLIIKFFLFIIALLIFLIIVNVFSIFRKDLLIYYLSFPIVFGSVLFPLWFFQGKEEMKYIAYINIAAKSLFVIVVLSFINKPSDIYLYVFLNSCTFILIGFAGYYVACKLFEIKFEFPSIADLKKEFRKGWYLFLSSLSISLYTTTNTFILGLFAGNELLGYYSAADKMRMAVQGVFSNAGLALFPHTAKLFQKTRREGTVFVKKYLNIILPIAAAITVALFIASKQIVLIVLGSEYYGSNDVFRIILFLPVIILLSNIYGVQVMLNTGYDKEFTKIVFIAGIINVLLSFILVPVYFEIGTAISAVFAELLVTVLIYSFVKRKNILNGKCFQINL